MVARSLRRPRTLAAFAGVIALSAYFGAAGLMSGYLDLTGRLNARLPFESPVVAGMALALLVALPASALAGMAWRGHPRSREAATLDGVLLLGWIAVEIAFLREFSVLQAVYAAAGVALLALGERRTLRQLGQVVAAVPLLLTAPLYRHWHRRWGASPAEVRASMPGDELVAGAHFTATRAITIAASAAEVWPWIVQVGYRRGGFYSYDLLDNLGRPSADRLHRSWQADHVGDLAAPMSNPPTPATTFLVVQAQPPAAVVWSKPGSSWSWTLTALPDGRTRLVTRVKQHYDASPSGLLSVLLFEFGDFAMMRKMLLGIRRRAEGSRGHGKAVRSARASARSARPA